MRNNVNKYVPKWAKILFLLAGISFVVLFVGRRNSAFAEWISDGIGYYIRMTLGRLSSSVPFSVGEILIFSSPILVITIIVLAIRRGSFSGFVRFLSGTLAILTLFYTGYVYTLGIGYHRVSIDSKLGFAEAEVSADNLYATALVLKAECDALLDSVYFSESGSSEAGVEFNTLSAEVLSGYEKLDADFPELKIKNFTSAAKPVNASVVMTKLDLLGVYTYFTGESNVNVHYPDYTTPYTIAHEMAHQRGIARENEANFIAFLVCMRSDSEYVRYSGYLNMLEYVASALYKTDKELYRTLVSSYDARIKGEINAYREFYQANKNEILGKISETVNDNYLKSQGTAGTITYSLVVRLCVSYYEDLKTAK